MLAGLFGIEIGTGADTTGSWMGPSVGVFVGPRVGRIVGI